MLDNIQIKQNWKEIKGAIQNVWAALSEAEIEATKGDFGSVSELVKSKYQEDESEIQKKIQRILSSFDNDTDRTHYFTTSFGRSPLDDQVNRDASHSRQE